MTDDTLRAALDGLCKAWAAGAWQWTRNTDSYNAIETAYENALRVLAKTPDPTTLAAEEPASDPTGCTVYEWCYEPDGHAGPHKPLRAAEEPADITSTDQLEAEQRGLPIPYAAEEPTEGLREILARTLYPAITDGTVDFTPERDPLEKAWGLANLLADALVARPTPRPDR